MAQQEIQLIPTTLPHVFQADIDGTGILKEIVLLRKFDDGSMYYIDVASLHKIDKGRIKKILSSQHATKYQCWELFANATLSNGMNALDFFHSNNVKVKQPKGAKASNISGSLADVLPQSDAINVYGTNPAEAAMDVNSKVFGEAPLDGVTFNN